MSIFISGVEASILSALLNAAVGGMGGAQEAAPSPPASWTRLMAVLHKEGESSGSRHAQLHLDRRLAPRAHCPNAPGEENAREAQNSLNGVSWN
jgi:hypothetical protein